MDIQIHDIDWNKKAKRIWKISKASAILLFKLTIISFNFFAIIAREILMTIEDDHAETERRSGLISGYFVEVPDHNGNYVGHYEEHHTDGSITHHHC